MNETGYGKILMFEPLPSLQPCGTAKFVGANQMIQNDQQINLCDIADVRCLIVSIKLTVR